MNLMCISIHILYVVVFTPLLHLLHIFHCNIHFLLSLSRQEIYLASDSI